MSFLCGIRWMKQKFVSSSPLTLIAFMLIVKITTNSDNGIIGCEAAPSSSVVSSDDPSVLELALKRVADTHRVDNLTRQHGGDIFNANVDLPQCETDTCVGLSSGTAGLYKTEIKDDIRKYKSNEDDCRCQCLPHLATFREDLNICVDDIHECTLAPFVSGSSSERIPFVFLPLHSQIIHPSKEISFQGVKAPICAVSGSQYLTTTGWSELRNPIDTDVPFRLFRDEGRTFLQWLGDTDLRHRMQGRLILVHLMCRDMAPFQPEIVDESKATGQPTLNGMISNQNIFSPCVAFRVVGTPVKHINNVTEVSFQLETNAGSVTSSEGLTTREYIVIGVCSLLLGLIYVASVFLYLHVKKRKSRNSSENNSSANTTMKNDQVTFGPGYKRNDSITGFGTNKSGLDSERTSGRRQSNGHRGLSNAINGEEMGIVKNNPLLRHYPNLNDNSGFTSDLSNSNSECDDECLIDPSLMKNIHTSIIVHPSNGSMEIKYSFDGNNCNSSQETECLPEENVSIVEDMTSDDKLENMKAIVNGTMRRKLYFNPAYFEPQLLMSPPAAAIEFLTKIREVITIAKYKMATKRYQPSLIVIPEENAGNGSETYANRAALLSRRSSMLSQNTDQTRKKSCPGCPGCEEDANKAKNNNASNCKNCGDKRNSIRKWLEDVSMHEGDRITEIENEHNILDKSVGKEAIDGGGKERNLPESSVHTKRSKKSNNDSSSGSDSDTIKANSINSRSSAKRQAPPVPTNPPKIIPHFMKPDKLKQTNFHPNADLNAYQKSDQANNTLLAKNSINAMMHSSKIYDKSELYSRLPIGSELYNNPQFTLNSPQLSQRSRCSQHSSHKSHRSSSRSRTEVLDQFANPQQIRHYEALKKLQQMPDMVYEAMANDFNQRKLKTDNNYGFINVPTPDYDETLKKWKPKQDSPYVDVPSPDYNTYGRSKRIHPPDSPIYSRKSPQHLIVDYETDSLERTTTKIDRSSITPPSNNSDLSSQPSPSLSVALPLEEEVEIRNTVYDRVEGFRKDGDELVKPPKLPPKKQNDESLPPPKNTLKVSEAYLLSNLPTESRIKYNTPYQGSMTIEVEHTPTDCETSTDSEQFEQDTLDRKPKKINNVVKDAPSKTNGWPQHMIKSENFLNQSDDVVNYSSLENMTSLPDMKYLQNKINTQLVLRSSGSFKSINSQKATANLTADENKTSLQRNLNSLRQIYESKIIKNNIPASAPANPSSKKLIDNLEKGRILTLEARHSKRQRKTNPLQPTLKKAMPPDLIPFSNNLYDNPKSPVPVDGLIIQKNLSGWNTDDTNRSDYTDAFESTSSESTEITGVSDTQANSEFESEKPSLAKPKTYSQVSKMSKFQINSDIQKNGNKQRTDYADDSGTFTGKLSHEQDQSDFSDSTLKSGSTNFNFSRNGKVEMSQEDADKIEILSSKSLSIHNVPIQNNSTNMLKDLTKHSNFELIASRTMPTKVFRVDVNPSTHGMQIALGLKDRAKKSKDLKNAWKKFVSKFQSGSSNKKSEFDGLEKASALSDGDDGISSMPDESITISDEMSKDESGTSRPQSATSDGNKNKTKSDLDSGYMSADSSESRLQNKKLYERFNFKSVKTNVESNQTDNDFAQKNMNRMQEIKESTESEKSFNPSKSPTNSMNKKPSITGFIPKNLFHAMHHDAIKVNVYSSDDERYSSCMSSESDEEYNLEDMCESGAESIETNSVFFKNVRNNSGKDELK